MRISKLALLILISIQLFGQSKEIVINNSDTLKVQYVDNIYHTLDSLLITTDELGNYFLLDKIYSDSVISYNLFENEMIIDSLISKNDVIRKPVFNQIFRSLIESKPINNSNRIFDSIISSSPFFKDSSFISYGVYDKEKIGAIINTKPNFNNYFAGLIGASNDDNNKWSVNGQIDIHMENQWRTAGLIDLHWKRLDEESQILNLMIEEPHPFGLPIGFNITYKQDLREGSFVNNESSVGIVKTVPGIAKFGFGGKSININSTAKGDSLGIPKLSLKSVYANCLIDRRNDYWIPNRGYYLVLDSNIGNRTIRDSSSVSLAQIVNFEKYITISNSTNILIKLYEQGIWLNKGKPHEGELIRYGGAANLRGYIEDNFKSDWVIIPSVEFNINFGSNQQLALFTDLAIQKDYQPLPYGVGIGFSQVSNNSVLRLFYGIGRGDKIKNGKIHLQFLTRL